MSHKYALLATLFIVPALLTLLALAENIIQHAAQTAKRRLRNLTIVPMPKSPGKSLCNLTSAG